MDKELEDLAPRAERVEDRIWRKALALSKLRGLSPAEARQLYQTLLSQAQGKEQ